MGREIGESAFSQEERTDFFHRLRDETKLLKSWFDGRQFNFSNGYTGGLEVEAWLVDDRHMPAARNADFLATLNNPLVVPELSQFNFEINTEPYPMSANFLARSRQALEDIWAECAEAARKLALKPAMIGILPTVRDDMLQLESMSQENRYAALTQEIFRLRNHEPMHIDIAGRDHLQLTCRHFMVEAACTSQQVHLKINQDVAKRFYNASLIAAAPLVAATANSPFLYGKSLWAETRIPAFEQAAAVFGARDRHARHIGRVTFGSGYVRHSLLELFLENLEAYPVMLPALSDAPAGTLSHLRLQNGTIWRWLRPIVGFSADGSPHLRIEQRVTPSGPTVADMTANMALFLGMAMAMAQAETAPEDALGFEQCRTNFYACARDGLKARVTWLDGRKGEVQALLHTTLLPAAKAALARLGLDRADLDYYFDDILARRLVTGRTGANWQRGYVHLNGPDFRSLTERYIELQETGEPVHCWSC